MTLFGCAGSRGLPGPDSAGTLGGLHLCSGSPLLGERTHYPGHRDGRETVVYTGRGVVHLQATPGSLESGDNFPNECGPSYIYFL